MFATRRDFLKGGSLVAWGLTVPTFLSRTATAAPQAGKAGAKDTLLVVIQLTGGILSAIAALGVLLYLNWKLTLITVVFLAFFGVGMSIAFKRLRPIFRERSIITAEVTGRLTETIGGIRLIKVYTAEEREKAVFGAGVQRLFQNIAKTITGTSLTGTLGMAVVGVIGVIAMRRPPSEQPVVRLDFATLGALDPFGFAMSPDGRAIVYPAQTDGPVRLWVRRFDEEEPRALAGTDRAERYVWWSPDSRAIAFFADGVLHGLSRTITALSNVR